MENKPSRRKRHGHLWTLQRSRRAGSVGSRHDRHAADIEAARRTIAGQVLRTPMLPAPRLSALTGAEVYVKYENLQVTNSFKERGALNKLASLTAERAQRAASSPCRPATTPRRSPTTRRGSSIPATIVMPVTTPFVKVEATQAHGAAVVLEGETLAEAQARAEALARERGLTWVHPYDDLARDRRAGHDRAGNAGGRARPRHAGDPDRRRRADRRQRDRGARAEALDRDRRRRGRALSLVLECADRRAAPVRRRRRWPRASR